LRSPCALSYLDKIYYQYINGSSDPPGSIMPISDTNTALARKLDELERKYRHHDEVITAILSAIRELTNPQAPKRRGIGFTANIDEKP
jgi:hypothetical protein